jgi:DNA-binding response OmpR family regulator
MDSPQELRAPTVLIVDEDARIRRLIQAALEEDGMRADIATDGLDALERVRESGIEYEAVVLDLNMPVMDGRTFFRALREISDVPVLIVSAFGAEEACKDLGADGAVSKPFDPAALTEKVREVVMSRGRRQATA